MWVLNNIRIYVDTKQDAVRQNIARLQPIAGGTIHQTFGYELPTVKIGGIIVGEADKDSLEALATTGATYTLSGYGTDYGSFYVSSVGFNRMKSISQNLRQDLDCTAPLYYVDVELYKTTL